MREGGVREREGGREGGRVTERGKEMRGRAITSEEEGNSD